MAEFLELMNQTQKIISQSASLAKQMGASSSEEAILGQLEMLKKKELMLVAVGEAKRGKSSALNAFLNEKDPLFPVDINLCTNVVTIVRYGERESVEAYIEDPKAENGCRVEKITREQIADYVSEKGNPNNYRQVKLLNIRVPNHMLKEGVVFVDTPGVGSLNIEHAETTYGFLPYADVMLFVSDADSGLTQSELNFLKRGYKYCKNILFPLTKKDLNENYNVILEDNREKISRTLNMPAEDVQIIAVSSMAKLRYLKSGSKTMLMNSNFPALEEAVWSSILKHRGEVLLLPFLAAAKSEMIKLADNVAAQYQMLDANEDVVQRLISELNAKTAVLDDLQAKGAEWRAKLSLFFATLQNDVSGARQRIAADAKELVDSASAQLGGRICSEANYTKLISDINEKISCGVIDIRDDISSKIDAQIDELERQLDFGVGVNEDILNKMGYVPAKDFEVTFPPKKKMDTAINWGRKISMNTMGGGTIGSVMGGFVGFCLGGPAGMMLGVQLGSGIGGLVGGAKGCVDALTQHDQLDVHTVIHAVTNYISAAMSGVNTSISNVIAELRIVVNASFEEELKSRSKSLRDQASQLQKNISMTAGEIPKKRAVLKEQSTELAKKLDRFDLLEQAAVNLGGQAEAAMPFTAVKRTAAADKVHAADGKNTADKIDAADERNTAESDSGKRTYAFL